MSFQFLFLQDNGYVQTCTSYGISVSLNNVFYFNVIPVNGVFEIDMHELGLNDDNNFVYNITNKRVKSDLDSTYLWHCRLAYIGKKRMEKLQHDGLLQSINDESFDKCESCISGKMARKPFPHQTQRALDLHGLIHTNVCGPLRHVSKQGASYFDLQTHSPILHKMNFKKYCNDN